MDDREIERLAGFEFEPGRALEAALERAFTDEPGPQQAGLYGVHDSHVFSSFSSILRAIAARGGASNG
jgi:hypothetical protein